MAPDESQQVRAGQVPVEATRIGDAALAHPPMDRSLDELLRGARCILAADAAAILLVDGDHLVARAASGDAEEVARAVRIAVGDGFAGRVAAEARPIIVDDVGQGDVSIPLLGERPIRSMLGVPILVAGRVIGVLHVGTRAPRRFAQADAQLLQVVADRIGVDLEYARLEAEGQRVRSGVEKEQARTRALAEIGVALAACLDYDRTLGGLPDMVVPRLGDCCVVDLVRPGGQVTRVAARSADPAKQRIVDEIVRRYPARGGRPQEMADVVNAGGSRLLREVPEEFWELVAVDAEHLRMLRALAYTSLMTVPLVARGQILGAISLLAGESGRRYDGEDLALAEDVARRAAIAVDNARLYREAEEARRRMARQAARQEALARASRVFAEASLDLDSLLDAVARHVGQVVGDACGIQVFSRDGATLSLAALYHPDPEAEAILSRLATSVAQVPGEGLTSQVVRTGEPLLLAVTTAETLHPLMRPEFRAPLARFPVHSVLAVALRVQGRVTGAMVLARLEPGNPYDDEDRLLLEDLADRAALAIETARLYREAQEARAHAEAASRAKDEFLATVSHELRTPLTPILVWSHMLETGRLDAERTADAARKIHQSARSQGQLIDDLLDVSRIVSGKLRLNVAPMRVAPTVEAAVESMRPAVEAKRIRLHVVVDPNAGIVAGDPERLQQVVWNLLSNAIKFTPDGGRVQVTLERVASHLEISVRDTGQGITPEFLPHIFERFRQADSSPTRAHTGLGLGLAIVRHLVEMHGGTVHAESAGEGRGATFTVVLPLAPAARDVAVADERPPAEGAPAATPSLQGLRVLVVDDEWDTCEVIGLLLRRAGAEVRVSLSAGQALVDFRRWRPDVVLSDLGMPKGDGYALLRELRALPSEEGGRTPVIALTAYARAEDRATALSAGFQMHVAKPVEPGELLAVVGTVAGAAGR